jgi:glycosyltransferase involved in cell wall biosynthesis
MPKVLFVGPLPPPPGGGETVTRALLRSDLGRRYHLIHCDTSRRLGVDRSGRLAPANWVNAGGQWARFTRCLLRERPALVHMPIAGNVSGLLRDRALVATAGAAGVPVIGHVHGGTLIRLYGRRSRATRSLIHGVFSGLSATIALSPSLARFFAENGLARESTVVSNPVDPEFLEELAGLRESASHGHENPKPKAQGPRPGTLEILFLGAVGHRKGVFDLVETLPGIRVAVPEIQVRVVGPDGTPGASAELRQLVAGLGLSDCVSIDGPLYGRDKAAAILGSDVLALPSYDEQFPCALLEAMAAGLPVLTTDVGGIPDMVRDGEHGYVLTPGDRAALTAAVIALADPERRRAMGESAAAHVAREYRIETAVDRIATLYEAVIRTPCRVPSAA